MFFASRAVRSGLLRQSLKLRQAAAAKGAGETAVFSAGIVPLPRTVAGVSDYEGQQYDQIWKCPQQRTVMSPYAGGPAYQYLRKWGAIFSIFGGD